MLLGDNVISPGVDALLGDSVISLFSLRKPSFFSLNSLSEVTDPDNEKSLEKFHNEETKAFFFSDVINSGFITDSTGLKFLPFRSEIDDTDELLSGLILPSDKSKDDSETLSTLLLFIANVFFLLDDPRISKVGLPALA
jgi:hypothetical protein